ncbi:PREDICTED: protein FAM26F [Ficedula albicollis]|uniref:protein FAM26F n=1 Tax=Ficedula albicollis TaxID=59894 RepID=UPI0007AD8E42|nr:PREDICTED: protein FAM26F [Ficedula albicollis]
MNVLQKAKNFYTQHQNVLGYSTVSLATVGIEQIFSSVVFQCPCNSASENMLYGLSFLLAPAFILLLIGYMVNAKMWLLLTGKCSQEKHRQSTSGSTCACLCQLLQVTAKVLVAPLTWIAVALLGANYYECAASGSSLAVKYFCKESTTDCQRNLTKMPCDKKLSGEIANGRLTLQTQSQLFGWLLIAAIMTVALISTCFSHCCSTTSYLQLKFWKMYSKTERELFETKAKEHAKNLAERNTECFFEATDPAPFHTPSREDWRKISFLNTCNSQKKYYSMLHKYANTNIYKSNSSWAETKAE